MALDRLKNLIRVTEAAATRRTDTVPFEGGTLRFIRSRWWHDATPEIFASEIGPYLEALRDRGPYTTIVDAGAATGMFAVAAGARFPGAVIHAFEPSLRQRILLRRNIRLNGRGDRVRLWPLGLWESSGALPFRTHGAMSSLAGATMLPADLPFPERALVTTLDAWARDTTSDRIDLIKMDIEGAELEALAGAQAVLRRDRPDVLVQAYHIRDGCRTLERCARLLTDAGYAAREIPGHPGLLLGTSGR
jgi:FkbM family methyltransferase